MSFVERFNPWSVSSAVRDRDTGVITGTLPLAADAGLRIRSATVDGDGQFLTVVFEPAAGLDEAKAAHPSVAAPGLCEHCGLPLPPEGGCSFCGPVATAGRLPSSAWSPIVYARPPVLCRVHGTTPCTSRCTGRQT